jgi:SAM-dependent methyltransferase
MHEQAMSWVSQFKTTDPLAVLDIGGRDLNGSTRILFPNANPYHVVDVLPGKGVDFVADAATWKTERQYDLVVTTETFEHAEKWREIILTAWDALRPGGMLVFTCAGPGRPVHSGVEAVWGLIGDEWYANVSPEEIREELTDQGWEGIVARQFGLDTQGVAVKPAPQPVILTAEQVVTPVRPGAPEVTLSVELFRTSASRQPLAAGTQGTS